MNPGSKSKTAEMTFWEHTEELLSRLRIILVTVFMAGAIIGFLPVNPATLLDPLAITYTPIISVVLRQIERDLLPKDVVLIAGSVVDTAGIYLMMSALIGVIVSTPIIAYELYKFINPALLETERRYMGRFILSFVGLFIAGAFFSYKIIVPITLRVLLWFVYSSGAAMFIPIADFFDQVIVLIGVVGLFFTFPVFFVLMVELGILKSDFLSSNRKSVYAGFIILAVILTADPTPITDMILLVPFIALFESTVLISHYIERNRREDAAQASIKAWQPKLSFLPLRQLARIGLMACQASLLC
jgi:sec-independent protein translocase protein TatC